MTSLRDPSYVQLVAAQIEADRRTETALRHAATVLRGPTLDVELQRELADILGVIAGNLADSQARLQELLP